MRRPMSGAPGRRRLVLLVEDHDDTRQMYAEYLRETLTVVEAADGRVALDILRREPPDLLITDLSLPGLDGFELIARVRKDASLARLPIICLSGYGGHAHDERARAAGCDRILQKPCMPDVLAEAAYALLDDESGRSSD